MNPFALEVENLVKVYQKRGQPAICAVDGLSFQVPQGVIFGLLGPNGAGKTTTLKILSTLSRPTGGAARVMGRDVVEHPLAARRHISVVLQETAVELFLSVRDNLLSYGRFHGLDGSRARARSGEIMAQFGLTPEAGRKAQDLSGGFRRRLQVAKVFMVRTPVLFLDEFSTGMDPILKRSVMEMLREEARQGRTIVLTTQVLSEAEELCDDILIINRGRAVAQGDLNTLKLLSEGVYDLVLTFDKLPEGVEAELRAMNPRRLTVSQNTVEVTLKAPEPEVLALVARLASRGHVLRVELSGASLEDIFVELTRKEA
jgi:ABC-2 type transport system ATP-binding protein